MKSQTEESKTVETKRPRFKIEKLEERIAPHHSSRHFHGNWGGSGNGGSGGHCGHGACK